ncbi:hypothetical protein B0H10DRAFT_1977531 [Mycena sp. CBHHK59/15]|nr:hypothetical protein B0H10DRAFT_1977531 [Mycena sp. CBHHK59/15]
MTSLARRRIVALCLHRCALRSARPISTSITKDEQTNDPNADLTNSHGMNIHNWYNQEDKQQNLRILTTLNPQRLRHTGFVDCLPVPYPHVSFYPGTPAIPIHFYKKNGVHQPFPAATRGFLYFHRPSDAPALAAGIRLTPNGRPSSFRDGTDLQGPEGLPWQISLFKIAHAVGRVEELRTQLLAEGLIHETDLTEARDATPTRKRLDPRLTLYSLSQPFPVAFERTLRLWVAGVHATRLWTYDFMFADNRMQFRPLVRPYAGALPCPSLPFVPC